MPFPKNRDEMVAGGYVFSNHGVCKGCQTEIEWWTTPRGKKMPFNLMQTATSPAVSHHSTCPEVDMFR